MIKKIALSTIVLLILAAVGVIFFEKSQGAYISNSLSERSKEFIKDQQAKDNSGFNDLLAQRGENNKGKTFNVDNCFSLVIPYAVFNSKVDSPCSGYYAFDRPRGSIVVFMENALTPSIDDAPGVSMRRQNTIHYKEKSYSVAGESYTGFIDRDQGYSITLYRYVSGKYFIFTLNLPEEDEKSLIAILSSVKFLNL